ncbi:hypothetical protein [Shewanella sp. UCD-KL12]|nr:hypothetical protein [Shewanella sp. UCD-KL12]
MNGAVTFGFMDETAERPWMGSYEIKSQRVTEVFALKPTAGDR